MKTLFWHDYETWGASPAQDRPSQFAGIRTDEALNIIDDPVIVYCQPVVDCLPHPEACFLTGITPQKAREEGVSEVDFFRLVYEQLAQPGTCGVGYNSIRFDDEVTRYGFYRNFYDPYEREWQNGNSRWDLIDVVRMTYALRPEKLQWPLNDEGVPSFKLEHLSQANGLLHEAAHDALSDVQATIGLAKLIKQHYPDLYDYAYSLRDKRKVSRLIDVKQRKPIFHVSSRFLASRGCAALVVPLAIHPVNSNSIICFDLSQNPQDLLTLSADEIRNRLYTRQEDLSEGQERIALKEIHINKSPMVATPNILDSDNAKRLGINKRLCEAHWQQLLAAEDIEHKLQQVFSTTSFAKRSDPEQQLYDGFLSPQDKNLLAAIRGAEPATLSSYTDLIKDTRLKTLLFRYRARHYPETLSAQEHAQWQQWCYQRLTDRDAGASIVLDDYFERLASYQEGNTANQDTLKNLLEYGDQLLSIS